MKIDRIIIGLNNNPTYTGFWNNFSKVIKTFFNIQPTLVFVGDLTNTNLDDTYGNIIEIPELPEYHLNKGRSWYVPFAAFYATSLFPNDICMTSGADQLPLSTKFFDLIESVNDEKYIIGFSGAYKGYDHYWSHLEPSSHHVAKGKFFSEVLNIDSWEGVIKQMHDMRVKYSKYLPDDLWGIDEYYISDKIINFKEQEVFHHLMGYDYFKKEWADRRIDRSHYIKPKFKWSSLFKKKELGSLGYDKSLLKKGYYTEYHALRPYEKYKEITDSLIKDLIGE